MNRRQVLITAAGCLLLGSPVLATPAGPPESSPAPVPEPLDFVETRYYHSSPNARYRSIVLRVAQWGSPDQAQTNLDAFITPVPVPPRHDEFSLSPLETVSLPPLDGPDFATLVTWSSTEGAAAHHTGYARLGIRRSKITWTASIAAENAGAAIDQAITFAETIVAWRPTTCGSFIDWLPGPETIPDGMWLDSIHTPGGITNGRGTPVSQAPPATPATSAAHPLSKCLDEE